MLAKIAFSYLAMALITCWFELGLSSQVANSRAPRGTPDEIDRLVSSRLESDGKLHYYVSSIEGLKVASDLGLSAGQELLLIQTNAAAIGRGLPCVGHSREAVLAELRKIDARQKFNIVVQQGQVAEQGLFKAISGVVGLRTSGTSSCKNCDFTSDPQMNEVVFIKPTTTRKYLRYEQGKIVLAALKNHADWKFRKISYVNCTTLRQQNKLDVYTLFKVFQKAEFINTSGGTLNVQPEKVTRKGLPAQLHRYNIFQEHHKDTNCDTTTSLYEPSDHRGKYVTYDDATGQLKLTSTPSIYSHITTIETKKSSGAFSCK